MKNRVGTFELKSEQELKILAERIKYLTFLTFPDPCIGFFFSCSSAFSVYSKLFETCNFLVKFNVKILNLTISELTNFALKFFLSNLEGFREIFLYLSDKQSLNY